MSDWKISPDFIVRNLLQTLLDIISISSYDRKTFEIGKETFDILTSPSTDHSYFLLLQVFPSANSLHHINIYLRRTRLRLNACMVEYCIDEIGI